MTLVEIHEISHREIDLTRLWGRRIDAPKAGTTAEASSLNLAGWVLPKGSPAVAIEVLDGETLIGRVPLDHRRPDVAEAFPRVAGARESGFKATVSALGIALEFELSLRAVLRDHSRVPLGAIRGSRKWAEGEEGRRSGTAMVSVVIPCYNQARFLGEAIESVLGQSHAHLEVLVIDDGSTDNTAEVASRYPGVRCLKREQNRGLAAARNEGIRRSVGDYLVFLDADDRLLPEALEAGLRKLEAHPACAFVSGYHRLITFDGAPFPDFRPPLVENDHYEALLRGNYIAMHATVMYRRAVFDSVGVFDTSLEACEDYDLYLRVAREYPVYNYGEVVAEYRQHGGNMVRDSALMLLSALKVLRAQLRYIRGNKRRTEAYNAGVRFWQQYYGEPLVDEVRRRTEAGNRKALSRMIVLAKYHPRGFASMLPYLRFAQRQRTRDDGTKKGRLERLRQTALRFGDRTGRRVLILLYHRVAELDTDPWALAVTPAHFDEHLQVLGDHARPMRLEQLSLALLGGDLPDRSVVVTFDDGYADNLYNAKPSLEHHGVPATVFVTSGYVGHESEVWFDALDRILLQPGTLPEELYLRVNGSTHQWALGDAAHYSEEDFLRHRPWRAWEDAPSARHSLYASLWELLHPLTDREQRRIMDELLAWGGVESAGRADRRCLTVDEVCALARGDLIEIGAHTVTHPSLSTLPMDSQREEIRESKAQLEEIVDRAVTSFAYPYGKRSDYTPETVGLVEEAGFTGACSNIGGLVCNASDRFQLPRFHIQDWDGEEFSRQLSRWFDGQQ